ncbi:DUF4160 domain-containing protein [Chitinivorax sp. B]|uniref:DUF4160 domain-containing protein n=1 Tax=Chitinivorax sp. B TaxID=2502235 RepID=UPI0010F8DC2A|nr:DUF4160 domain-containing protein [Chitinivorax sp. B]
MSYEDKLKQLQRDLAQIDLLTEPRRQTSSRFPEFLILRLKDIKLKMYQERGHSMPHIHVDYGSQHHVASFSIDPPARIEGSLHRKYDKSVIEWISVNSDALLKIWSKVQSGGDPSLLVAELAGNA